MLCSRALESESHGAGLFIGLGWSGQWNATFNSSKASSGVEIRATASLEGASFVLLPEVRSSEPPMSLVE